MAHSDRKVDKTHLSIDTAEERGLVHRDYLAHCLRWSHVVKFLQRSGKYREAVVLDAGCGKEFPLAKTLYVNKMSPASYLGVDMNRLAIPDMLMGKKWFRYAEQSDAALLTVSDKGKAIKFENSKSTWDRPNVVTCFEMLEHIAPEHARRMLVSLRDVITDDGTAFVSTPCFNGDAAGNHINEMTYQALGALIEDVGWGIVYVWGTFASIADYKDILDTTIPLPGPSSIGDSNKKKYVPLSAVFERLREYYDTNLLAIIFAPLFPAQSRNCLWQLVPNHNTGAYKVPRRFPNLMDIETPWSSSPDWEQLQPMAKGVKFKRSVKKAAPKEPARKEAK